WTDLKIAQGDGYALIRRMKLPPLPVAETTPAPPLIRSIDPDSQSAGGKVLLHGAHFSAVKEVRVISDDGEQSDAIFNLIGDTELAFVLPARRQGVTSAAIVVQGPGGLTVTLPRDTHTAKDAAVFDRFRYGKTFCFNVARGARLARVEGSAVYASRDGFAYAGGRGKAVLFLKDGSSTIITRAPGVIVYHEPFARIFGRAKGAGECELVSVPAIRPSYVEALLQYNE
ncbi:MAG TPA: IPT/TIG domain-containing protein, partial [Pirellulales bacterium]|nr:IPT/TIG domain-containing protein [Pirellulales bacterium]